MAHLIDVCIHSLMPVLHTSAVSVYVQQDVHLHMHVVDEGSAGVLPPAAAYVILQGRLKQRRQSLRHTRARVEHAGGMHFAIECWTA